jgi:hypothetical protein
MLESSPYAAPEHLRATVVDARADVYTLGVLAWRALTGTFPYGDGTVLVREHHALPDLASLRPGVPAAVARVIERCLAEDPERRPRSAREVAEVLRGRGGDAGETGLVRTTCQACAASLRPGLRLCLQCGKEAVQFSHAPSGDRDTWALMLVKATEEEAFVAALHDLFASVGEGPVPALNFLVGDARMYSKAERERLHALPVCLFDDLDAETARALGRRVAERGVKVKRRSARRARATRRLSLAAALGGIGAVVGGFLAIGAVSPAVGVPVLLGGIVAASAGFTVRAVARRRHPALARLRAAPAALPASDPLVARMAALLVEARAPDVRERVSELALALQRLCDHRAALVGADRAEVEMLTAPLEPLVALLEREIAAVVAIDRELATLDEGALVRALAASEARGEAATERRELLAGLDRLRQLEDLRAAHMQRLLEAASLLDRTVTLGLAEGDPTHAADADLALALAALGADDPEPP